MVCQVFGFYLIYTIMVDLRRYFFWGREKIESFLPLFTVSP